MATIAELKQLSDKERQLFTAIEQENVAEVKMLLSSSGDDAAVRVNCLDRSGLTPLDQASFKGNEQLAEMLLAAGANANNRAHDDGYTALMFAALAGQSIM